ncbi:DUF2490 domain-containing protein [Pontibacter arcticus]|nr:DUF2490 domain-containing protein [Pontibacter arcticus]
MRFFVLLTTIFLHSIAFSGQGQVQAQAPAKRLQDYNRNVWLAYNGDHKITSKWGLHTEVQYRRADFLKNPMQLLVRNGINYFLTDNAMLTAGYVYAKTHPFGDYPAAAITHENRLYQQLQLKNSLSIFELTHRYRQEQRWVKPEGGQKHTYTNRSRYMVRATLPLSAAENTTQAYPYLTASNEIFVNFGENVQQNIFDQNRLAFAFGYRFSKAATAEVGYMHQIVQRANGLVFERNHLLQAGFTYNFDFTKNNTAQ